MQNNDLAAGFWRRIGLKPLAAAAILASMMLAPPAIADCGPVPEAQDPLPAGTVLSWSTDATGACILETQEYQCTGAIGEPC